MIYNICLWKRYFRIGFLHVFGASFIKVKNIYLI